MFGIGKKKINNAHLEAIKEDAIYINTELQQTVKNLVNANQTLQIRDALGSAIGESHGGKRNVYDIYGYPEDLQFRQIYNMVRRDAIGNRIAFGVPASCWGDGVSIEVDEKSVLEDELGQLKKIGMLDALKRGHSLARMGNMSAVFVGVADSDDFTAPLGVARGDAIKTLYFKAYAYDGIQPVSFENDRSNPRYGLPTIYQLQVITSGDDDKSQDTQVIDVHHSRVIPMSENNLDNDLEGVPTLETAFNLLLDIRKATGGSAEAYFRNCSDKTVFKIDKDFAGSLINNPEAKESFDAEAQAFVNGMKTHIMAVGTEVDNLQTSHHSPRDTVEVAIWQLSSLTRIPKKILIGEGAGQLSGSEDKASYNETILDIQQTDCEGWLINALEILDVSGIITLPEKYKIAWPVKSALSEKDEAGINQTKSQTVKNLSDAKSTIGGDGLDLESSMKALDLDDIEFEEPTGENEPDDAAIAGEV